MENYQIGIDLGGTKTEAILFDPAGMEIRRKRIPTPRKERYNYTAILESVYGLITETGNQVPEGESYTVGIGIPGIIDGQTQLVQNANTTSLIGHPFQADLEKMLGRSIVMENDANCFTLAEAKSGAARGYRLVFGIIMGTGCGGGLCIDGRIHHGRHGIAGEWGHISVDPLGMECYCGNLGCIETKISGTGISREFYRQHGRRLNVKQIVEGFRENDSACTSAFLQFIDNFGRCLGGLVSALDPDAVVLGGGLSNIDELYTLGLESVRQYAFHTNLQTPLLKNVLGDSAGVFGAAWLGNSR